MLNGLAGSGKSTIAQTICDQLSATQPKRLAASYFFSREEEERRNPENVIRTLAYQLAQLPQLRELITQAVENHIDILHSVNREQLQALLADPLFHATDLPSPLVIVLDALDECDRYGGDVIPLLAYTFRKLLPKIRVKMLITSRFVREVQTKLEDFEYVTFPLHGIKRSVVDAEIRVYLVHHLKRIAYANPGINERAWPPEPNLSALVERSGGLFIFASTVVKYVDVKGSPASRLDNLIRIPVAVTMDERYSQLDRLYLQVLKTAMLGGRPASEWSVYLKRVAGAVALIQNPLPEEALVQLLNYKHDSTRAALHSLGAVVIIPDKPMENPATVVRIFHPSFPDFITNPKRCDDARFLVKKTAHYALIARRCLEILNVHLHVDMCHIDNPSLLNSEVPDLRETVQRFIPAEVAFACKFWLDSLLRTTSDNLDLITSLTEFCCKHILSWLETCSLIGALPHVLGGLQRLHSFFEVSNIISNFLTTLNYMHRAPLSLKKLIGYFVILSVFYSNSFHPFPSVRYRLTTLLSRSSQTAHCSTL